MMYYLILSKYAIDSLFYEYISINELKMEMFNEEKIKK